MTLQFNEGAYSSAYEQGQRNQAPDFNQMIGQPLMQGLDLLVRSKDLEEKRKQEKQLYELQLQEAQRKQKEAEMENKTMGELLSGSKLSMGVAPTSMLDSLTPPTPMGGLPQAQQPGGGMVEKFRNWQRGGKLQVDPSQITSDSDINSQLAAFGLPPEAANMTPLQIESLSKSKKLFAAAGESDYYNPEQTEAIASGDPTLLAEAFNGRIPKAALNTTGLMGSRADNRELRKNQFSEAQDDKSKARYRNYLLDMEQRDPVIKELNKQSLSLGSADQLINLAKSGNTISSNALGSKIARAMGEVGVLTDQDVVRYVQSGRLDRAAADKLSKMITGAPTEATLNEIQQIGDVLRDSFQTKIQPRYDNYINAYSKIEGVTPEQFSQTLSLSYGGSNRARPKGGSGKTEDPLGIR